MTAALASGSAPLPSLPQPRPSALPLLLGRGPSPFEASRQPSSGRPKAANLRPNPLTGTNVSAWPINTERLEVVIESQPEALGEKEGLG